MNIYINSIKWNNSIVDGPGIRTVLFLQGCNLHCPGCQNSSTWNLTAGKQIDLDLLVNKLNEKVFNKKITISGGEPLYQLNALILLVTKLHALNFDICLYTGHERNEVPQVILEQIHYLKTGRFIFALKTATKPYVGSTNQIFEDVISHETID